MPSRPPQHRPPNWRPPEERAREYDRQRNRDNPGRKLIFSERWRAASKAFLAEPGNQLCGHCGAAPALMVDHRKAHRGDLALFWARDNWVPSCKGCNSAKAASAEGGFGNPRR